MSSTFVYVSSNCSEKPTTSKSESGRALSADTSGSPRARSSRSMSTHGAYARSASVRGSSFRMR